MIARDAAALYLSRGWAPIPIPWRDKNPGRGGWQKLRVTLETLGQYFNGARQNIGILLGEPSGGLVDIDLDCIEAVVAARHLLPDTGSVFGRAGNPRSHHLFISPGVKTRKFTAPDGEVVLELRATGIQTVFPPSVHPSGEIIEWVADNGPAEVDGGLLTYLAGLVAAAALLARGWRARGRHDAALGLAGGLKRAGWSLDQAELFMRAVSAAAHDEEGADRMRAVQDTYSKDSPTTGWRRLGELLGRDIVERVCEWLEIRPSDGPRDGWDGEEWPQPDHISQELLPVPAFDPDVLLPEPLRGWILDQAESLPCPIEFIAVPALVTAGSVIGARCGIRPKVHSHWVSISNLWGGIVGAPGSKKSPAIYAAFQPLGQLIRAARADYAEAMEDHSARKKAREDQDEEAPEQDKDAPIEKRYKINDSTIEKLADLLVENPGGLLVQRDELVGLIASWDKQGHEQDRAFFLESWNGYSDYSIDRIKRGSSYLRNLCLSVFGGIQPAKLAAYLNQAQDTLADDGMSQRFQMLVYPDPLPWKNVDRAPSLVSLNRAHGVFEALAGMVPQHWGAGSSKLIKFPYFVFEEAAQAVFNEWYTELHISRLPAEENPMIAQYLAKLDNLFLGLALIFHLIDIADTQIPQPGETLAAAVYVPSWVAWVSLGAARRAAAWCDFLEAHARRIYGMAMSKELRAAQALAAKVRGGKLEDGFTVRDVIQANWHGLTTPEDVHAALGWLEEEGWVRSELVGGTGPGTGRRTTRYRLNPACREAR